MSTAAGRMYGAPMGPGGPVWTEPVWPLLGNRWAMIAITILGFAAFWPLGLVMMVVLIASGRARRRLGIGRGANPAASRWARAAWANFCGQAPSSGNHAFDEYRLDALRRLEDEQKEFAAFLERLRFARDKSEFDAFMAERRQRPETPPETA